MNITVYCGSRSGAGKKYMQAAAQLGEWLGKNGHTLIYGGGGVGLMGALADATLKNGGQVYGIIPQFLLEMERGMINLTSLEVVDTMSTRKKRMIELGEAFVALPGAVGTLEEITEIISRKKLDLTDGPCILLNLDGFYDPLKDMLKTMISEDFYFESDLKELHFPESVEGVIKILENL